MMHSGMGWGAFGRGGIIRRVLRKRDANYMAVVGIVGRNVECKHRNVNH